MPFSKRGETAVDRVGRRVMIDERRRAAADRSQRADLAADFDAFERVRPIEPPPDELAESRESSAAAAAAPACPAASAEYKCVCPFTSPGISTAPPQSTISSPGSRLNTSDPTATICRPPRASCPLRPAADRAARAMHRERMWPCEDINHRGTRHGEESTESRNTEHVQIDHNSPRPLLLCQFLLRALCVLCGKNYFVNHSNFSTPVRSLNDLDLFVPLVDLCERAFPELRLP